MNAIWTVVLASLAGVTSRWYTLRVDYRQYPSYPQGYAIHLSMGLLASFLGALAFPALVAREFAAASFLALAATQFREVRKIEREALTRLEETELARRGAAYIEGIARVFEARNYLAMLVALLVSVVLALARPAPGAAILITAALTGAAILTIGQSAWGPKVGDIASVRPARMEFDGPLLTVEGTVLLNIGRAAARETYLRQALAAVIEPRDKAAAATLASPGQRQAILHDLVSRVGVFMDVDEPEFAPVARRRVQKDAVIVVILPQIRSFDEMASAIRNTPVLEASVRLTGYRDRRPGVRPRSLGQPGPKAGGG